MARRRGKVLEEPLHLGRNAGSEKLWRSGRAREGGEASPKAGQQEALPPLSAGAQKCFVWGWNSAPPAASPTGALGLRTLQRPWGQHQARVAQSRSWSVGTMGTGWQQGSELGTR